LSPAVDTDRPPLAICKDSNWTYPGDAGTQPLDMEAFLTSPNGKSDACEIRDMEGHIYDISFVPEEEGLHHVSIKYKGIHISGRYKCTLMRLKIKCPTGQRAISRQPIEIFLAKFHDLQGKHLLLHVLLK